MRRGVFSLVEMMVCLMVLGLLAMLSPPARAQTNYSPNWYKSYNFTLTNGQTLMLTNTAFVDVVRQGKGESMFLKVQATNASTALVTAGCDVTPDSATWTTTQPFTITTALNGTTANVSFTNWPAFGSPPTLNGCRKIALTKLVNAHTSTITGTLWFSRDNSY
jgi:prepilin-type N-terminal cleavage/methylation domain-containing protein